MTGRRRGLTALAVLLAYLPWVGVSLLLVRRVGPGEALVFMLGIGVALAWCVAVLAGLMVTLGAPGEET